MSPDLNLPFSTVNVRGVGIIPTNLIFCINIRFDVKNKNLKKSKNIGRATRDVKGQRSLKLGFDK